MNIQKLMQQAQQMQARVQREMAELVLEASAGDIDRSCISNGNACPAVPPYVLATQAWTARRLTPRARAICHLK